ncbi:MAG: GGDEF domain-containing protein [Oscillospiraceae bacterium]|nr:GGDEF domain-containing protein [Oscillospiraceae bacterium]
MLTCLTAAAIILFFHGLTASPCVNQLETLNDGWYYLDAGGARVPVTLPQTVRVPDADSLTLYQETPISRAIPTMLSTRGAKYDLSIYADDELLYQYCDCGVARNDAALANVICLAELPDHLESFTLSMNLRNTGGGVYHLSQVQIGSWETIIVYILRDNIPALLLAMLMLVLGALLLVAALAGRSVTAGPSTIYLAIFLLVCGLWSLTDSPVTQLVCRFDLRVLSINLYAFMLLPIPISCYILNVGDMKRRGSIRAYIVLCLVNVIAQSLLAESGARNFFQMLPLTHGLMLLGICQQNGLLLLEYRKTRDREIGTTLAAYSTMGLVSGTAIILYHAARFAGYQILFLVGMLLFVMVLLGNTVSRILRVLRDRAEVAVYRRLAEEDKLTMLQNRRAFDLFVQSLEQKPEAEQNAALIFMDVNDLKELNDHKGHAAGDGLLIAVARCIERAYGSLGYCYRIGGDEFCVIIPDPKESEGKILSRLRAEEKRYNQDEKAAQHISIAAGCSYLRAPDGTKKTISQWKAEADREMYLDKMHKKTEND